MYEARKTTFINRYIEPQDDGDHFITRLTLDHNNPMVIDTPLGVDPLAEYKHYDSVMEIIDIIVSKKLNK